MANWPIDQRVDADLKQTPRERLWVEIRRRPADFTLELVAAKARMNVHSARDYLQNLMAAGIVQEIYRKPRTQLQTGGFELAHYRLIKDVGVDAPLVNEQGAAITMGRGVQQMWQTLRICGEVDARVLAAQASTEAVPVLLETAKSYLRHLHRAGYLELTLAGRPGRLSRYRLRADRHTGPRAPQIQRCKQVFDPNLGKVVFREQPELIEEVRDGLSA